MEVAGHRVLVDRDLGVGHANALERRHRLELQEAVRVVEGGQQGSHRGREREVRQGRGHMAAHPDVLLAVQHEVGQRRHHRLPETGQHLPRRRLQPAVPQQRHQRHHEQEVPRAKLARALDRRECDLDVRVVHQRHQQRAERRILDIAERAGRQQPPRRALLAGVAREGAEPVLGRLHVRLLRARCQRRRRDDGEGLVGAVQERAHHIRGGLSAKRGQRAHRGHPHRRVGIPQRPLDSRQPAVRGLGAGGFRHLQRARPDLGRLVRQQQRRDQVALVQGIEQVDGVEHAARFRVRQLAHQRFDRLRPEVGAADVGGHHVLLLDAASERPQVLLARPHRREHPQPDHGQAGVAQLLPVPAQAPVLDQDEDQQRPHALRQPVHRHVDERLGAVLQFHRQRQEQYLARGLVHGVTQRGVEHAGQARRPQRAVEQHHHRGGAQAHRQHQQREADAEHAMDAAGQPHLDHEADQRQVNRDLREERRDGVGIGGALGFRRRHVELLLDDRGADGRKADHQRDHLQVPGRSKQLDGLAAADALVLAGLGGVARARRLLALQDEGDDEEAEAHDRGADQQHLLGAERFDQKRREARAGRAAEAGAAADEAEDALGLPRIVDVVGQRPELADQEEAEDQRQHVEGDRHPVRADGAEQEPEQEQQTRHAGLRHRDGPAPGHRPHHRGVALHDEADQHAGAELHPRQVVGAQARDELRPRDWLDDVVAGHRQERVQKHQQRGR